MARIVYVNGEFMPYEDAKIPIMDRGFLFADGIYEVSAVLGSRLVDNEAHLARLDRSLGEIRIANPYTAQEWTRLEEELVRRNNVAEGLVYMEVTRGVAERADAFGEQQQPQYLAVHVRFLDAAVADGDVGAGREPSVHGQHAPRGEDADGGGGHGRHAPRRTFQNSAKPRCTPDRSAR